MRRGFRISLAAALVVLVLAAASGPTPRSASAASYDFAATDALAASIVTNNALAGSVLVISNEDGVLFEKSYGTFTPTLLLPIYSSGKWLAGATIMSLVDDGLIDLDAPVSTYLPAWTGVKGAITVRQLFSHTSGMANTHPCLSDITITLAACVDQIYLAPLAYTPGTTFYYGAAPSMQVGARIAEVVTGQTWAQIFSERIGVPLGMTGTYFYGNANPSLGAGAISTASEYTRFLRMLLRGGELDGTTVLSGTAVAEMHTNYNAIGLPSALGGPTRYGVGNWIDLPATADPPIQNSSYGGGGTMPWINWNHGYAGIFLNYTAAPNMLQAGQQIWAAANAAMLDTDDDQIGNTIDNCAFVANATQLNTDAAPLLTPGAPQDKTRPIGDVQGDACDTGDDNDGLTDAAETAGPPCAAATAATDPLLQDTDGDRVIDGAECALGADPADAASKPLACAVQALADADGDRLCDGFELSIGSDPNIADTDGDGINDGVEYRGYGSSPLAVDSDLDGCGDGMEIASVDTNTIVNSNDLLVVALQFGTGDRPVQDVDKNGLVNSSDLLMVALRFGELC